MHINTSISDTLVHDSGCKLVWMRTKSNSTVKFGADLIEKFNSFLVQFGL